VGVRAAGIGGSGMQAEKIRVTRISSDRLLIFTFSLYSESLLRNITRSGTEVPVVVLIERTFITARSCVLAAEKEYNHNMLAMTDKSIVSAAPSG
jgi:hypothetical protein